MKSRRITGKLAAAAAVVSAIVLISLTAGGGNLEPTAPPGPTMHTLEDIYAAVTAPCPPVAAAFDAYLKIDSIPGEAKDDGHKEWIDLLSYSHGITRPPAQPGTPNVPQLRDLTIVKSVDKATPKLMLAACDGKVFPKVEIHLVHKSGPLGAEPYMQYVLSDATVVAAQTGGPSSGEPLPSEQVSFNYAKIEWSYTYVDDSGAVETTHTEWDVINNTGQ